jgi:hypothetical protein
MREIDVNFTGGSRKRYVVTLSDVGEAISIESVVKRGMDYGSHRRMFWHKRTGRCPSDLGLIIIRRAHNDATELSRRADAGQ